MHVRTYLSSHQGSGLCRAVPCRTVPWSCCRARLRLKQACFLALPVWWDALATVRSTPPPHHWEAPCCPWANCCSVCSKGAFATRSNCRKGKPVPSPRVFSAMRGLMEPHLPAATVLLPLAPSCLTSPTHSTRCFLRPAQAWLFFACRFCQTSKLIDSVCPVWKPCLCRVPYLHCPFSFVLAGLPALLLEGTLNMPFGRGKKVCLSFQ